MPRIGRWLGGIRDARARHRERHVPSGFDFLLADRIDYVESSVWDALTTGASFFLGRPYLRALEANPPENLVPRYAVVFREHTPVAAVVVQRVRVSASQFVDRKKRAPLGRIRAQLLVCGNLLSWGRHGVAFARGEDPAAIWCGVAEAIYRLAGRRSSRGNRISCSSRTSTARMGPERGRSPGSATGRSRPSRTWCSRSRIGGA